MAKLFVPSVRCPNCHHTNDVDFRFCQGCGYQRKLVSCHSATPSAFDLPAIDRRLGQLLTDDQATSYARQKQSLQKEMEDFLSGLPGTVVSRDICRFLVFKDRHGKSQVHENRCTFLSQRGRHPCGCPVRLSYKTVDSYIGKLRSIFQSIGRDGAWDRRLGLGNPAADKIVHDYLRLISAEQLQARITPKQATPFFIDKPIRLSLHIDTALASPNISPVQRFLLARDQAYFKAVFFSGDRPGDMGQVKVPELLRFPTDDGLLFNHVWGKTLRDGDSNVFGIRRNPNAAICPVAGIERYIAIAQHLQIDLTTGYLFRPTTLKGGILDAALTSATAESRLKRYLQQMGEDDGETLHGFRSGCAITLALSGADITEIMDHVGWAHRHTASYYLQLAKVLNPGGASTRLASDNAVEVTSRWADMNELKRFVCAFPAINPAKRNPTD